MSEGQRRGEITRLLVAHREGDGEAFDQLLPLVYAELRRMARRRLGKGRPGQTLNTTALVHEAFVRLVDRGQRNWQDSAHFFAVAATAMRQVVADYARERRTLKRGGDRVVMPLEQAGQLGVDEQAELVLAVDEALSRLSGFDPRQCQVVECRFFAGLTEDETAAALAMSKRTVQRTWIKARAWLDQELGTA